MGCWNKTCGLSNLHITCGTPVYTFVLEHNSKPDLYYAHSGLYKPCLVSFNAIYDDYGGGEECTGDGLAYILDSISDDIGYPLSIESFFSETHEETLKFQKNKLYHCMMRKDIVDDMLAWYRTDYRKISFADSVADIRALLNILIERYQSDEFLTVSMDIESIKNNNAAMMLSSQANQFGFSRIVDVYSIIEDNLKSGDVYKLEGLLVDYIRGIFVNCMLDSTRKQWTPGSSMGSQSYSGDILIAMGESIKKAVEKEKEDYDC